MAVLSVVVLLVLATQFKVAVAVNGFCGTCTGAFVCVSSTQFSICDLTTATLISGAYTCPIDNVCSVAALALTPPAICVPADGTVRSTCAACNECDANKAFACTGERTFEMCLGTDTPSSASTGYCGASAICSSSSAGICVPEISGVQPTCTDVATPSPLEDPTEHCKARQRAGNYAVDGGTTCKQYVKCYVYDSAWRGQVYDCPGSTYFNETTQLCGTARPAGCSS